jgi:hypothetical protein
VLSVSALRCAAGSPSDGASDANGSPGAGGEPREASVVTILGAGSAGGSTGVKLDPLCGETECVPDDPAACSDASFGGSGSLGASSGGEPALGGQGGQGGEGGGRLNPNPGALGATDSGCQVRPVDLECAGPECERQSVCQATGIAGAGAPCLGASSCGAGLACVGAGPTGVCRPYCCAGTTGSCDATSYCAPSPSIGRSDFSVPVCVPLDSCSLTESFPCAEGADCSCSGDLGCIVVRSDGKTACAVPGKGLAGDPCTGEQPGECAHGHVCAPELGCLKQCSTVGPESGCLSGQLCQTPAQFPAELGVCVGVAVK